MGALVHFITRPNIKVFQPMNVNFGLFPPPPGKTKGKEKHLAISARALKDMTDWIQSFA
jgi:methylenetetrahydrofolate--tRNA-(uracil-5-)-methyltransferase